MDIEGKSKGLHLEKCVRVNDIWINDEGILTTRHIENCKKVIATTDTLFVPTEDMINPYLPKPTEQFIQQFVDSYIQGNQITKVKVDYESSIRESKQHNYSEIDVRNSSTLIVNNDNTINIELINEKQSWSREEVIELIKDAVAASHDWSKENDNVHSIGIIEKRFLNNWIQQNL